MKKLLAMLLVLTTLSGLTACGRESTKPEQKPVTLNIVTSYGGDDGNRKNFEKAVRDYEAATGVVVNDGSATSNEEWKAKVLTDFETGSEPDVLFFFTDADAAPFITAGKVVSIEEIRTEYPDYASNMKESMLPRAADGRSYAVPSAGYWESLFVNKSVLNACGVEMPGPDYTWDQFLIDCQTILDNGYTPIACSLFEVPHYWFEFAVMNNGTVENHQEVPSVDEEGNLVDDDVARKWLAALEDIKDLYTRGFFPANTLTATDAETVAMFGDGEAAFLIDGSWKIGYFSENHLDTLGDYAVAYVPCKGERAATEAVGGISMGYFITRKVWENPEKRDAAVQFVSQMTSDEVLSTFVTTEVTALTNGASPAGLNVLQQSAAAANAGITAIVGAVQDSITSEAKSNLFGNIQNVVTERMTAEEALTSAMALN